MREMRNVECGMQAEIAVVRHIRAVTRPWTLDLGPWTHRV